MSDRLGALAEGLVLAAVVAAPWAYGGASEVACYALAGVLLAAAGAWRASLALAGLALPRSLLPSAALCLLPLGQILLGWSTAPALTLDAALVLWAMVGALGFVRERSRDRPAAIRIASAVLVACVAQAAFGVAQHSWNPTSIYGHATPIVTTPFGSFVNHNHFAGLLEMGSVLALGMALGKARADGAVGPPALALGGICVALGAVHLASGSRGGLVALAFGFVSLGMLYAARARPESGGHRKGPLIAVLVGLFAVGFGLRVVPEDTRGRLATLFEGPRDLSGRYRMDIAGSTLRLIAAHPIRGSGLGAFPDALPAFKRGHGEVRVEHAECDLLEFAAEAGLIGCLGLGWFGWEVGVGIRRRLRESRGLRVGLSAGSAAAVVALLVHSLFDFNLRLPSNALVFVVLVGLAGASFPEEPRFGRGRASAAFAVILLVGGVASAWRAVAAWQQASALSRPLDERIPLLNRALAFDPLLSRSYELRGVAWMEMASRRGPLETERLGRAVADLERAVELRPLWGEAWAYLGWVRFLAGDQVRAMEALERGVLADPTNRLAGVLRAEVLARSGALDAAAQELRRLRAADPSWSPQEAATVAKRWSSSD